MRGICPKGSAEAAWGTADCKTKLRALQGKPAEPTLPVKRCQSRPVSFIPRIFGGMGDMRT